MLSLNYFLKRGMGYAKVIHEKEKKNGQVTE
jgi:hypothetical protein